MISTWISILGSIASIGAAIWACVQAHASSKAATKSEKMRDELISRRELVEVSQVHAETTRILKIVSTVGPACNPSRLRGYDCGLIAKDVEEYSRYVNEYSSHFNDFLENKAKKLSEDLRQDIEALSEARSFDDKKAAGKSIYYKIDSFLPFVKELSDVQKENVLKN